MTGRNRRSSASDDGAVAVEFALIAPILILLLIGTLEIGRGLWCQQNMQFAVEEATRYGMVNSSATSATLITYAKNQLIAISPSDPDLTVTATVTTTQVSVTATYTFRFIVTQMLKLENSSAATLTTVTLTASSATPK